MMGAALFAQIPRLPGFGGSLEGESLRCAEEAERITRRAMELSSKETASLAELPMLTRILLWTGREREAERLIEDHVPKAPNRSLGCWSGFIARRAGLKRRLRSCRKLFSYPFWRRRLRCLPWLRWQTMTD